MTAKHRSLMIVASRFYWLPGWGLLTAQQATAQASPLPSTPAAETTIEDDRWTNGFFLQLGFSFLVGLAMGYALKIAFKIALIVGGVALLSLFALQYAGVADVNWSGMEIKYDGLTAWLMANGGAFKDFISDHLSSAASFTAGLLVGLKL